VAPHNTADNARGWPAGLQVLAREYVQRPGLNTRAAVLELRVAVLSLVCAAVQIALHRRLTGVATSDQHSCVGERYEEDATMDAFDHILHWKLTHGSHPFPGKDGGTCINEAAIVAAGFEYQAVRRVEDMPECFSRPICRLAMRLNDAANDVERQHLIRFVTRLACADTPEVERERAAYIQSRTAWHSTFLEGLQILEDALAIGRQAEASAPDEVRTRMEVLQRSTMGGSIADSPNFAKVKSWFEAKIHTALAG
jgi:hypothetical protein